MPKLHETSSWCIKWNTRQWPRRPITECLFSSHLNWASPYLFKPACLPIVEAWESIEWRRRGQASRQASSGKALGGRIGPQALHKQCSAPHETKCHLLSLRTFGQLANDLGSLLSPLNFYQVMLSTERKCSENAKRFGSCPPIVPLSAVFVCRVAKAILPGDPDYIQ